MHFFSKFSNSLKIKNFEKKAQDVLELANDLKALRVDDDIVVVAKDKIVAQFDDTFPSNPARAAIQIMSKLNLTKKEFESEKEIWTCGFRESEQRWVWYKNSHPKMTVSFDEAYPDSNNIEKKIDFCLAKYGTSIIENIKSAGIEKVSKEINALILENSYTQIKCSNCESVENYTIDDLIDENKQAKYDSNFVLCNNCGEMIKLL